MSQSNERQLRAQLACALRWTARMNLHEGVANHFSVATSADGAQFLMNAGGKHFSRATAGGLLALDSRNTERPAGADATAWRLHGYFHRHLPRARCLMHSHMPYATALASLQNWKLLAADQNACRFYNRVAYDEDFGGMLLADEEAARQCAVIGDKQVLVMRGHGVLFAAPDVATAFDLMYYFERACRNQWLAMASGRELLNIDDETAEKTARQWEDDYNATLFAELQAILDEEEPEYRN